MWRGRGQPVLEPELTLLNAHSGHAVDDSCAHVCRQNRPERVSDGRRSRGRRGPGRRIPPGLRRRNARDWRARDAERGKKNNKKTEKTSKEEKKKNHSKSNISARARERRGGRRRPRNAGARGGGGVAVLAQNILKFLWSWRQRSLRANGDARPVRSGPGHGSRRVR